MGVEIFFKGGDLFTHLKSLILIQVFKALTLYLVNCGIFFLYIYTFQVCS